MYQVDEFVSTELPALLEVTALCSQCGHMHTRRPQDMREGPMYCSTACRRQSYSKAAKRKQDGCHT